MMKMRSSFRHCNSNDDLKGVDDNSGIYTHDQDDDESMFLDH